MARTQRTLTPSEVAAVLAGLRLLQEIMVRDFERVAYMDQFNGLDIPDFEELDELCAEINFSRTTLVRGS